MRGCAWLVVSGLFAGSGCLIVPTREHVRHVVSTEDVDLPPPAAAAMALELASARRTVTVRAVAPRVCTSETRQLVDVTHVMSAELAVMPSGGADDFVVAVGVVVAPVTLAVSGIITALVIAGSSTTTTHERRKAATWRHECPVVGANLPVAVTLPSGAVIETTTGSDGRAYVEVPAGEPDSGVVAVRVSGLAPRAVRYCPTCIEQLAAERPPSAAASPVPTDRAGCLKLRSERMRAAQEVSDLKERTRQLLALPVCDPK